MEPIVINNQGAPMGGGGNDIPELQYKILPLAKVQVRSTSEEQRLRAQVKVSGKWYNTTTRFWTSFFAKFGFSDSIFKYFEHQEVFDRIVKVKPDTELRFCVENDGNHALAISNPNKPIISPNNFMEIARKFKGSDVQYATGVLTSFYRPPSGDHQFKIGPDDFENRFLLETPLDGYGKPATYLSLLRQVCLNGAVAYAPAFRNEITIGDDPDYNITRALESFDSDDGYSAVRQRFESSQLSPASLWECLKLYKQIKRVSKPGPLLSSYEKVVGDIYDMYGVANLDSLSEKKLKLLPAKCRVYDLINFASEASTHQVKGDESRIFQAWLGTTISDEFDLEGTNTKKTDFEGVFMPKTETKPAGKRPKAS